MKGEPVHSKKDAGRAGPQGTQVFSRDQISDILDESGAVDSERELASLVLLTSHPESQQAGTVFRLSSDRLTIGRSSVCDLSIDEPSMSSEHARLVFSDQAWRVINLLSTNGVFVNDEKVFSHRLHDGDEIRLGRVRLRYREPVSTNRRRTDSKTSTLMRWAPWVALALIACAAAVWMLQ
ncbi:MAG TPA: FHA domain-containing protein [Wenzhouxiangellaceae bacterium]|nr:FHA domain-containing protein [Wenzhouxiangellaceae bacterium]